MHSAGSCTACARRVGSTVSGKCDTIDKSVRPLYLRDRGASLISVAADLPPIAGDVRGSTASAALICRLPR